VRFALLLVSGIGVVACNAIVGFGTLEKVDNLGSSGGTSGSSGSSGESGSSSSSSSSSGDIEGGADAPAVITKCDPKKPFKAPVKMPGPINSGSHETMPSLTSDELTIFFQRTVGVDGGDLLMATRPSINDAFGEPALITQLSTGGSYSPTITGDGLSLFWVNVISGNFQIFHTTRPTKASNWNPALTFDIGNTNQDEMNPFITSDGNELYFMSNRSGQNRIYRSKREAVGGEYLAPSIVSELAGANGGESGFALSADGLFAYVGSSRTGGSGGIDILRFERASTTAAFGGATHVTELNSPEADWPGWLSPDNCRFYFGSLRVNPGDLFMATRDP